jgi:hypothetical protein
LTAIVLNYSDLHIAGFVVAGTVGGLVRFRRNSGVKVLQLFALTMTALLCAGKSARYKNGKQQADPRQPSLRDWALP